MDIEYQNTYTQVLVENFDAVIKQNFQFQTQIRLLEKIIKEKEDVNNKLQESVSKIEQLEQLVNEKQIELAGTNELKQKVLNNDYLAKEKDRIQIALNEYMQKCSKLERENESSKKLNIELCDNHNKMIDELQSYIQILEENVSPSKLKKIIKPVETIPEKDGSTF